MSQDEHNAESTASKIVDNGLVRIGTLITAIVFFTGGAWQVASFAGEIEAGQDKINTKQEHIIDRIDGLEAKIDRNTADRWRKTDQKRLCREQELLNSDWKCGHVD